MFYNSVPIIWNKKELGEYFLKRGKQDFGLARSYQIMSLLNCIDKIVRKVIAKRLLYYCEYYSKLHSEQIGGWRERLAIYTVATLDVSACYKSLFVFVISLYL